MTMSKNIQHYSCQERESNLAHENVADIIYATDKELTPSLSLVTTVNKEQTATGESDSHWG